MRKFKLGDSEDKSPSEETVSKYRDFGKVVTDYERLARDIHRKPLYKDRRLFLFVLIALLLLYLLWESSQRQKDQDDAKKDAQSSQQFAPLDGLLTKASPHDETLHPYSGNLPCGDFRLS